LLPSLLLAPLPHQNHRPLPKDAYSLFLGPSLLLLSSRLLEALIQSPSKQLSLQAASAL